VKRVLGWFAFALLIGMLLAVVVIAFFRPDPRPAERDGRAGRVLIEPEGAYLTVSCSDYRSAPERITYHEYEFTSNLAARRELCPLNISTDGNWRVSEDLSIDAGTDTVRLTASLDASSFETARSWPVPPSLTVYCWDLSDAEPGNLNVALYHYGEPHDFGGTIRVSWSFNGEQSRTWNWGASSIEAEAIFLPDRGIEQFISDLLDTDDDSGFELEAMILSDEGQLSFDVSGWEIAVRPLLEECGFAL